MTHWKRPWCWERLKAGGEGDDRAWDGWMASPTWWASFWAPGLVMDREAWRAVAHGIMKIGHDLVTELNCVENFGGWVFFFSFFFSFYIKIFKKRNVVSLFKNSLSIGSYIWSFVFVVFTLNASFYLSGQSVDITSLGFWNLDQYGRIEFSYQSAHKDPWGCVWSCFSWGEYKRAFRTH